MIECLICGNSNDDDDVMDECPYCGAEIEDEGVWICEDCSTVIDCEGNEWLCPVCGNAGFSNAEDELVDDGTCPNCGSEEYDGYCSDCGYPDLGWIGDSLY